MSKRRVVLAAVFAVALSGCYHATVETGRPASGQEVRRAWAHGFLYGLVPPSTVNVAQQCPGGVARIETQQSFLNMLANGLTFGLYTPMEIRVQCSGAAALEGAEHVRMSATLEQKQDAMLAAAARSSHSGAPVLVVFE